MGGKTGTTTATTTIPKEVMERYKAVNQMAEEVAKTPFQPYTGEFVAPLTGTQQAGISQTQQMAQAAQPYYQQATQNLLNAQSAATPGVSQAGQTLGAAQQAGQGYANVAGQLYSQAGLAASPYYQTATQATQAGLGQAMDAAGMAQPYYGSATQQLLAAQSALQPQLQQAGATGAAAGQTGAGLAGQAQNLYQQALSASSPYYQAATQGTQAALAAGQPYQQLASQYGLAGGQAISPQQLNIGAYMSPYTQAVADATQKALMQQQQMEMSGQLGNLAKSGAFGGDRAGIIAANLAKQQQLGMAQAMAPIYQQGYAQALAAAQQQQGVGLSAEQANRAALQQTGQQMAALGQQGFGQQLGAAQQMASLGQSMFGQGLGAGQALAGLGQQQFGQGMSQAQLQSALAQQGFGAGTQTAQQLAALGTGAQQAQLAGAQGVLGAGQQMAGLGQALYGQAMGQGQALAGLGAQQFGQGATTAQQQAALAQQLYGMGSGTAQQLAALGSGAQQAGLQGAQAVIGAGTLEQQTKQAEDTAKYQQFLQQRGYPFQVAQFLANIAMGTGALSGSTTTTQQPIPFFSDRRLKDDVKEIGKTNDGMPIYSFKYKGDDATQIGLMAQDVEKKHPDAVGLAGGYKTVDYEKATEHSARPERMEGGLVPSSMGGSVYAPGEYQRGGYAIGGDVVDPNDLQAILQQQQQSFGPFGQSGLYGGSHLQSPYGDKGGIVPQTKLHVPRLQAPSAAARAPESVTSQAMDAFDSAVKMKQRVDQARDIFGKKDTAQVAMDKSSGAPTAEDVSKMAGPDIQAPKAEKDDFLSNLGKAFGFMSAGGIAPRSHYEIGGNIIDPYQQKPSDSAVPEDVLEKGSEETRKLMKPDAASPITRGPGNDLMDAAMMAKTAMALFALSDRRAKDNIEPIGKTFDGQTLYRFDFGGGGKKIGLIAQEVLKKHPEAVAQKDGMLMVDYKRATDDSANHYYEGGLVPRQGYQQAGVVRNIDLPETYGTEEYDPAKDPFYALAGTDTAEPSGVKPAQTAPALPPPRVIKDTAPVSTGVKPTTVSTPDQEDSLSRVWSKIERVESGGRQFDNQGRPLMSSKGAVGVGQILPSTGPEAAKLAGLPWDEDKFYNDENYNRTLGKAYFNSMYAQFGSPQLAAAAYNAGPGRVKQALQKSSAEGGNVMSYLPDETKNYVSAIFGEVGGVKPATETAEPKSMFGGLGDGFKAPLTAEGKEQPFSDFLTSKEFIVPFLSGLKGMAQSKSPFLGSAILEGLGTGAESYVGLQKQLADIAQTRATTGKTIAETARGNIYEVGGRLLVLARDPQTGQWKPMRGYEYFKLPPNQRPSVDPSTLARLQKEAMEDEKAMGAPTGAPAAAPTGTTPTAGEEPDLGVKGPEKIDVTRAAVPSANILTDEEKARLDTNAQRVYNEPDGGKNEPDFFTPQASVAKAMGDLQNQMSVLATSLASLPRDSSLLTAGPLAPTLLGIANTLNQAANTLGYKGSFISNPEDLGSAEAVNKAIANLSGIATTEAGQRAVSALAEMASRFPTLVNSTGGRADLLADIMVQQRREIDRNNYARAILERESNEHPDIASKQGRELYAMFDDRYKEPFWARDRQALKSMFNDQMQIKGQPVIGPNGRPMSVMEYLYKNGANLSEKQKDWFRNQYKNPDVLRYFGI